MRLDFKGEEVPQDTPRSDSDVQPPSREADVSTTKLTATRLLLALFLVAVLILGTRLVWVASRAETGWETLGLSSYNALLAPIGLQRKPIGDRNPAEQAEIWLCEVDRVIAAHPDDAQITMGAAWMLDSPGLGFQQEHVKLEVHLFGRFVSPEVDHEGIAQAQDRFEAKCATHCLELAARATELQPENVDWWRMRALLLFPSFYGDDPPPRRSDWLAILDECARHDPDNALYDYLAAVQLWETSADYDWDDNSDLRFLKLKNPERFAEGVARFEQGRRKRYLTVGQPALPAVAEFLGHAGQPHKEEADLALERFTSWRVEGPLLDLRRWQEARAGTRERERDPARALALWGQQRHVCTQLMTGTDSPALHDSLTILLLAAADIACLQDLAGKHPGLIPPNELAALETERENLLVDVRVVNWAYEQVGPIVQDRNSLDTIAAELVTAAALKFSVLLLILAVFGLGLARWLLKAEGPKPLGTFRHLFAWSLGWGLAVFLLGICPAEALGRDVQATIVAAGTCLVGIGMLIVVFRTLVARCRVWAQGPRRLPIVSIIAVITVWQATVAAARSVMQAAVGPDPSWYSQFYAQPSVYAQQVSYLPLRMLVLALLPAALLAVVVVGVWALSLLKHKRRTGRFPRAHFVALGLMSLSAVLVLGAFALAPDYLGGHCWPPARGWEGYDAEVWSIFLNTPQRPWHWAALQWTAYAGGYVSAGLSLLLVGTWYRARHRRDRRHLSAEDCSPSRRASWGGLLHCLARSALAMAACCLLVYLALAPAVLRAVEKDYQRKIAYVRDPRAYSEKIRKAEAAIRNDPAAMEEIRAQVAAEKPMYGSASTDDPSESDP